MKRPAWLLVLVIVAAGYLAFRNSGGVIVDPVSPPPGGPDLLSVFKQHDDPSHAAADARDLAVLCRAIAKQIEYDASRDVPRLTTGKQMDDLRRWAREYFLVGESLGVEYPKMRDTVKAYFDTQLGDSGGPISPEQRVKWVDTFKILAQSAEYAAAKL